MIRQACHGAFLLLFLIVVSMAQSGGSYRIEKVVIGSGGTNAGDNYSLIATAGQSSAGARPSGGPYFMISGFWVPEFAPTAAHVSVSGRVMMSTGSGLRNAIVTIAESGGQIRTTRTASFGYYVLEDIQPGHTYLVTVTSKSHQFTPRTVSIIDNVTNFDFTALP